MRASHERCPPTPLHRRGGGDYWCYIGTMVRECTHPRDELVLHTLFARQIKESRGITRKLILAILDHKATLNPSRSHTVGHHNTRSALSSTRRFFMQ